jgi:hypothetical protein
VLYYTRYRDCGNGVAEIVWMLHHFRVEGRSDLLRYFNLPWGGVRWSNFGSVAVANKTTGQPVVMKSVPNYGDVAGRHALSTTGGYTMFGQSMPLDDYSYSVPLNGSSAPVLVMTGTAPCSLSTFHTTTFNKTTLYVTIQPTTILTSGAAQSLVFANGRGGSMLVLGVLHWAWQGNGMYFWPASGGAAECNAVLAAGDTVTVTFPPPSRAPQDNLVLSFVVGNESSAMFEGTPGWQNNASFRRQPTRNELGSAGLTRDYLVWAVTALPQIGPGTSFFYRQYMVVGPMPEAVAASQAWVNDTRQVGVGVTVSGVWCLGCLVPGVGVVV